MNRTASVHCGSEQGDADVALRWITATKIEKPKFLFNYTISNPSVSAKCNN